MKRIVVASTRRSAGKTSMIIGLSKAMQKKIGYIKPLGDRLIYKKKRLWDYDSALIAKVLDLGEDPEEMSIGFEHAKLRYMYDEKTIKTRLENISAKTEMGKEILFIEGPSDLQYGTSINLNSFSFAKNLSADMVLVLSGSDDDIIDDIMFYKNNFSDVPLAGVILNKVKDPKEFSETHLETIKGAGINVLGIIPFMDELTFFTVKYVADTMLAKVIAGQRGLDNVVKRISVGAMTGDVVLKDPSFNREPKKLVVTSGDRSDMIIASLETKSSGIILTNNILPPSNVVSKAEEAGVPLLLVQSDTYKTAKHLDDMDVLITKEETGKISLLEKMMKENIKDF